MSDFTKADDKTIADVVKETGVELPVVVESDAPKDEAVELTVEETGGEPVVADTEDQPEATERKKRRGPRRYATLTSERDQAREEAMSARQIAQQMEQEIQSLRKKQAESEKLAMDHYAARLASEEKEAKEAHIRAQQLAAEDPSKASAVTEATANLSKVSAQLSDAQAYQKAQEKKPAEEQQQQPQQQQVQPPSSEVRTWLRDNPWFDAIKRDSQGRPLVQGNQVVANPDFDADMHDEAMLFNKKLIRQINAGQSDIEIESPEYFAAIRAHMKSEFPDQFEDDEDDGEEIPVQQTQRKTPQMKGGSPVAGGNRTEVPGQKKAAAGNPQSIKLDASEVALALKLATSGAMKNADGSQMSPDQAKKQFAIQKWKAQQANA